MILQKGYIIHSLWCKSQSSAKQLGHKDINLPFKNWEWLHNLWYMLRNENTPTFKYSKYFRAAQPQSGVLRETSDSAKDEALCNCTDHTFVNQFDHGLLKLSHNMCLFQKINSSPWVWAWWYWLFWRRPCKWR